MSFKIMPVNDTLRNRDQFIFELQNQVNTNDKQYAPSESFYNYDQAYFWFNNTVRNFPPFAFDENTPEVGESEAFCIHLWWNPPSKDK